MIRAIERVGMVPAIASRFPLSALPDALHRLDQGPFGKIVLDMACLTDSEGSI